MSRATTQMRNFAERLITCETRERKSSETQTHSIIHVCETLRPHLAILMGNGGFRALLARALVLAAEEFPWMGGWQISLDGNLEGLDESRRQRDPGEFFEGSVVLVAQLLALLFALIGETLTMRLVGDVWPEVQLYDLVFGNGIKNEKKI